MGHFLRTLTILLLLAASAEAGAIKHVIVIAMENKDASDIYGNANSAPYINGELLVQGARAGNFIDPLPDGLIFKFLSEPHYVFMEAGTNKFASRTFRFDGDPSAKNLAVTSDHLVNQLEAGEGDPKQSWMTYQEGIGSGGLCPVASSGLYAAKHNPFVFFADVAGNPPSPSSQRCTDHTRDLSQLTADLTAGSVAKYVFISPNLCNDMHGDTGCPAYVKALCAKVRGDPRCAVKAGDTITFGDAYLKATLPPLIDWAKANAAAIFIVWDEGNSDTKIPFIALGAGVKPNYRSNVTLDHGSIIRTVETIFSMPALKTVEHTNDFSDFFKPGSYP